MGKTHKDRQNTDYYEEEAYEGKVGRNKKRSNKKRRREQLKGYRNVSTDEVFEDYLVGDE